MLMFRPFVNLWELGAKLKYNADAILTIETQPNY